MAGFHVTGVDKDHQPRYAGDVFIQADALEYVAEYGWMFDAIHASPPCQFASESTPMQHRSNHPNLIPATRAALQATGKPYAIENVENARRHLINPVKLCGTMFGLSIWRHRYFEIWPDGLWLTLSCAHYGRPILVNPGSNARRNRTEAQPCGSVKTVQKEMQIDWMVQAELTEAIPPAYCEWIGHHLITLLTPTIPPRGVGRG